MLTAKMATFVLWYCGFEPVRQGTDIALPTGAVEVASACAGINLMILLLQLSGIFLLKFPLRRMGQLLAMVSGIIVAFLINTIRVMILLLLRASFYDEAFHYWHNGGGQEFFGTTAMVLFGICCYFLLKHHEVNRELPHETLR